MILQVNCSESCYRIELSNIYSSELQEMVLKAIKDLKEIYEDEPIKAHLNQVIKKKIKETFEGKEYEYEKTIAFICSRFEGGPGDFVMDLREDIAKTIFDTFEIHDMEDKKIKPKLE